MSVTSTGVRFSFCAATSPPNPPPRINTRCRAAMFALLFCNRPSVKIINLIRLSISDARCPMSDSWIFQWNPGNARPHIVLIAVDPYLVLHQQRTVPVRRPCGGRCVGPCSPGRLGGRLFPLTTLVIQTQHPHEPKNSRKRAATQNRGMAIPEVSLRSKPSRGCPPGFLFYITRRALHRSRLSNRLRGDQCPVQAAASRSNQRFARTPADASNR